MPLTATMSAKLTWAGAMPRLAPINCANGGRWSSATMVKWPSALPMRRMPSFLRRCGGGFVRGQFLLDGFDEGQRAGQVRQTGAPAGALALEGRHGGGKAQRTAHRPAGAQREGERAVERIARAGGVH